MSRVAFPSFVLSAVFACIRGLRLAGPEPLLFATRVNILHTTNSVRRQVCDAMDQSW